MTMATIIQSPVKLSQDYIDLQPLAIPRHRTFQIFAVIILALAWVGISFFAYQTAFVPHTRYESPDWFNAQWVHDPHTVSPVLYARKDFALTVVPDNAFLTIQGWQSFSLYVDGNRIDQSKPDESLGLVNRAYIYDVTPFLKIGSNSISIRASNADTDSAAIRAVVGISYGNHTITYPTDSSWKVTSNTQLANPNVDSSQDSWQSLNFSDSSWNNGVQYSGQLPPGGVVDVLPALFEHAMPPAWLSAGQTSQAIFTANVNIQPYREVWLRLASTGTATVLINGTQIIAAPVRIDQPSDQFSTPSTPYISTGLYDISKQMHSGINTISIVVQHSISIPTGKGAYIDTVPAIRTDVAVADNTGIVQFFNYDSLTWRAAGDPSYNQIGTVGNAQWNPAILTGLTDISTNQTKVLWREGVQVPVYEFLIVLVIVLVGLGIFLAVVMLARNSLHLPGHLLTESFYDIAISSIPAIGAMLLLLALRIEPLMPRPFPFTWPILWGLLGIMAISYLLLMGARRMHSRPEKHIMWKHIDGWQQLRLPVSVAETVEYWPAAILIFIGFTLATYQLGYESYWQDEVTSMYAAIGILQNGIPHMLSGFIYPKAELFSYMLAGVIAVFGQDPSHTRMLSVVEYCVSLGLVFAVGRAWFNRWVGYLSTAILLVTPMTLQWARQARMYQQAELAVLITAYLFYRATRSNARPRDIYVAMLSVVLMYLSHEETFIILPAIAIYFLAVLRLRWVRNEHWWIAGMLAIAAVSLQLYLVNATHPIVLGTDHTQQPNISLSLGNIDFYGKFFFSSQLLGHTYASLGFLAMIVIVGSIIALFIRDSALRYLVCLVGISILALNTIFTLTADRYIYPLLPLMALIAANTCFIIVRGLYLFIQEHAPVLASRSIVGVFSVLVLVGLFTSELAPISQYSLAVSRAAGLPYQHIYPDYADAGQYIRAHWQPGDVLVTISPAIDAAYYAYKPQYLIYADKALYFSDQNGMPGELATGAVALLNANDVTQLLNEHHRIWVLSSSGYSCCTDIRTQPMIDSIRLVYEGGGTYVYLRT